MPTGTGRECLHSRSPYDAWRQCQQRMAMCRQKAQGACRFHVPDRIEELENRICINPGTCQPASFSAEYFLESVVTV